VIVRGVVAVIAALVLAPAAHAASATSVVMLSDSGDYIGGGVPRLYHPGNAQISVSGSTAYLDVSVSGGNLGDSFDLEFAAPPGRVLTPGTYVGAQRAPFREAGRPGIDISGDGRGCNTIEGLFEVKAFDVASDGTLQRLWIVYEQHCEGGESALFGEVRIGVPVPDGALVTPGIVRWPATDVGRPGAAVPVTVVAAQALTITDASIAGADAADFVKRVDDCTGKALGAGGSCQVYVRPIAAGAGTRTATLNVRDSAGRVHGVALQAFAYGGTTRWHMVSDQGDWIGQGKTWDYRPADGDLIAASGSRQYLGLGVNGADGTYYGATFAPAQGDIIAPGTYTNATRYGFNGTGPGMDVSGEGRGCNTLTGSFTVNSVTFGADGSLRTASVTFEQHCEGGTPALRGTLEFRAGDTTAPAPWMVGSGGGAGTPSPLGPGTGSPATGGTPGTGAGTGTGAAPGAGQQPATPRCGDRSYPTDRVILGTRRADRLRGRPRGEMLVGGPGNDRLFGLGGADCIDGGGGKDHLDGGRGNDIVLGGRGNDILVGGRGNDVLSGDGGNDVIRGGAGRDTIRGGPGRDVIDCGPGRDVAVRGKGDRYRRCEKLVRP
jgi:RTX calcium-binding nonapeptide repeat (4 copies)